MDMTKSKNKNKNKNKNITSNPSDEALTKSEIGLNMPKFSAIQKVAFAWSITFTVLVLAVLMNISAAFRYKNMESYLILKQFKPLINHWIWVFGAGLAAIVLFYAIMRFSQQIESNKYKDLVDKTKNNYLYLFKHYIITTGCIMLFCTTVSVYNGPFSSVPFVIFGLGAIATESLGVFFLTMIIHLLWLYFGAIMLWGLGNTNNFLWILEIQNHTDAQKDFLYTASISYCCIILIKIIETKWINYFTINEIYTHKIFENTGTKSLRLRDQFDQLKLKLKFFHSWS